MRFFFFFIFFFWFFGSEIFCTRKKNVKILCVSFLFCVFVLGGVSHKSVDKRIHYYETKVSNPHKKTPSRVRHHHRARGHKDVL